MVYALLRKSAEIRRGGRSTAAEAGRERGIQLIASSYRGGDRNVRGGLLEIR
jgi:hypothetical protein